MTIDTNQATTKDEQPGSMPVPPQHVVDDEGVGEHGDDDGRVRSDEHGNEVDDDNHVQREFID